MKTKAEATVLVQEFLRKCQLGQEIFPSSPSSLATGVSTSAASADRNTAETPQDDINVILDISPCSPQLSENTKAAAVQPSAFLRSVHHIASSWGWTHGLCILANGEEPCSAKLAPYSIFPSPIPQKCLDQAEALSPIFAEFVDNMTQNQEWLQKVLAGVKQRDPEFTGQFLDIAERVYGPALNQRRIEDDIRLTVIRSDYMIEHVNGEECLRQVELNTISVSFSGLAEQLTSLHRLMIRKLTGEDPPAEDVPHNDCGEGIRSALASAHHLYCEKYQKSHKPDIIGRCILFIVREQERNIIDQSHLEYSLNFPPPNSSPSELITTVRMTMIELAEGFLEPDIVHGMSGGRVVHFRDQMGNIVPRSTDFCGSSLYVEHENQTGFLEVSVVYFRAGYDPIDFIHPRFNLYHVREMLEKANAVKCPNILCHLVGLKKIQATWCKPEEFEQCLPDKHLRDALASTFVKQVDPAEFASPDVLSVVNEAIETPENFILKPQREGGLNNIHGPAGQIRDGDSYILMEKIRPNVQVSVTLDPEATDNIPQLVVRKCVSELGSFGVRLMYGRKHIRTHHAGYLLRTKDALNPEGGVATGSAFLDSPLAYRQP